jgi:hypothetical protein
VVDDPCRTAWNGTGCASGTLGVWTFGQLMATMSGNSDVTSSTARNFVSQWLQFWLSPQTKVNPDRPQTIAARPLIGGVLLWRWLTASGCTAPTLPAQTTTNPDTWLTALQTCPPLDLKVAPFRLLAISNRIDLDGRDYNGNNGAPGELRFAFGNFNTANPAQVSGNAEVILEYHFPNSFPPFWWAFMFHNLSRITIAFGPSFSSELQSLTDLVVGPNAQPGGPNNGSSIGQIRTDENAFDAGRQWEFRQFALALPCTSGSCLLAQVPVSQTPPTIDNNTPALTTFLTDNQAAISTSSHVVPPSMLGGASLSPQLPNSTVWNTTGDSTNGYTLVNPLDRRFSFYVRHFFAFSTCIGCHYRETDNSATLLFHINPRVPNVQSQLSNFLNMTALTDPATDPNNKQQVPDPNDESYDPFNEPTLYSDYNEIWRRACEIRRVFAGIQTPFTTATGHH